MTHVGTICTHCADGCRTTLGVRDDHIIRGNNRDHSGINGEFLCVKGRYAFDFVEHPDRLQSPMLRSGDRFEPIAWAQALEIVAKKFSAAKTFGVIGSNHITNEENYFLAKMARQGLKTENIDHHRTGDLATLFDALWWSARIFRSSILSWPIRRARISAIMPRTFTPSPPARCAKTSKPRRAFVWKRAGNSRASKLCATN
jgi:anaerobic selenocysteine-containing dehydrogenase